MIDEKKLEELVLAVLDKPHYSSICPDFVSRIGVQELKKCSSLKEAVNSTISRLHQVGGAYLENRPKFPEWRNQLDALPREIHSRELKQFCLEKMGTHASTSERLPILEEFYQRTLSQLAPIHSILDLGCGLNPLALPWMPLADDAIYLGLDIYKDMTQFDQVFLQHILIRGTVKCADILAELPKQCAQIAFILKMLPLLDQIEKNRARQWLESIPAEYLLVSYPIRSLGGKNKGMQTNYSAQFAQLMEGSHWQVKRFEFSAELAFLVHR